MRWIILHGPWLLGLLVVAAGALGAALVGPLRRLRARGRAGRGAAPPAVADFRAGATLRARGALTVETEALRDARGRAFGAVTLWLPAMDGEPPMERYACAERLAVTLGPVVVTLDGPATVRAGQRWKARYGELPEGLLGAVRGLSPAARETLEVLNPTIDLRAIAPGEEVLVEGRLQAPETDPSRGSYRGEAPRWRLVPGASGALSLTSLSAPDALSPGTRLAAGFAAALTALAALSLASALALRSAVARRGPVRTVGAHHACGPTPGALFAVASMAPINRRAALDGWLLALRCGAPREPRASALAEAILEARGAGCEPRALELEALHDYDGAARRHASCGTPAGLRRAAMLEANLGRFPRASALLQRTRAPSVELPTMRLEARIHLLGGEPLRAAERLQDAVDFLRRGSADELQVQHAEQLQDVIDHLRASRGDARARERVLASLELRRSRGGALNGAAWSILAPSERRAWLTLVSASRAFTTERLQLRAFAEEPSLVPAPEVRVEDRYDELPGLAWRLEPRDEAPVLAALRRGPEPLWPGSSRWHAALSRALALDEARLGAFARAHAVLAEDAALLEARRDVGAEGTRDARRRAITAAEVLAREGHLTEARAAVEALGPARHSMALADAEDLQRLEAYLDHCSGLTPARPGLGLRDPHQQTEALCRRGPWALLGAVRSAESAAGARSLAVLAARLPQARGSLVAWARQEDAWVDLEDPLRARAVVPQRVILAMTLGDPSLRDEVLAVAAGWREALRRPGLEDVWDALE